MTTILTTTGISLYNYSKRKNDNKPPTDDQMRQCLRIDPKLVSSEANSLLQMATPDDYLVLFHTQTAEAIQCANLLKEYFNTEGFKHTRLVALDFQGNAEHIETVGLRNLVNTLIDEIETAIDKEIVINATAGLKAQVVYSTMIGMLYHIPVKYMYEGFQKVVTFNPIALGWDTSLFLQYNWFFHWLYEKSRSYEEVAKHLQAIPDRENISSLLALPDEDGDIFLSPMGEALRRKFIQEVEQAENASWPDSANIERIEDKIHSSLRDIKHHFPKDTLSICYKIAEIDCVQAIIGGNFENTTMTRIKKANADGTILILWADNEKATNLKVQTTAQGNPQTNKVASKIKDILGL